MRGRLRCPVRSEGRHARATCLRGVVVLCACLITTLGLGMPRPSMASARVSAAGTAVTCDGARDLLVSGSGAMRYTGAQRYDHVCVVNHGNLATSDLTLYAQTLFVDASSRIIADGESGDYAYPGIDCPSGIGGAAGVVTIVVQTATVLGRISARGGDGAPPAGGDCSGGPGAGGAGGHITLHAISLTLSGQLDAGGGAGAASDGTDKAGAGGAGGVITVLLAHPNAAALRSHLSDVAGAAGAGTGSTAATPGAAGTLSVAALSAAGLKALQALSTPSALPATLGKSPARQTPGSAPAGSGGAGCGAGDLSVATGDVVDLSGVHSYRHVCIHNGGILRAGPDLTLLADTIAVEAGGQISADGVVAGAGVLTATSPLASTGTYSATSPCAPDHATPHAGVPGAAMVLPDDGTTLDSPDDPRWHGGAAGGALTLIANRIVVAGTISANGARGTDGLDGGCSPHGCMDYTDGGGGGSGGGILVRAGALTLTGAIVAEGGAGGAGGIDDPDNPIGASTSQGSAGSTGCIKLLVDTLYGPLRQMPATAPVFLGRLQPTDPIPPPDDPGALYFATTGHSLSGAFATFYRQASDPTRVFGRPRTEAFVDGTSGLLQYFDRVVMREQHGHITLAPLGQQLTAGQHFSAPHLMPPGALRFANGYVLSGAFLDFWRAHGAVALLGTPISQPFMATNGDGSGRRYLMQWTDHARLELHLEAAARDRVQLGLLGVQALKARGWL